VADQALIYPWAIEQGVDFPFGPVAVFGGAGAPFANPNGALPTAGSNVSLSGFTATAAIRQLPSDTSTPLVSISTTPNAQGVILIQQSAGLYPFLVWTLQVIIYAAATLTLPAGYLGGAASVGGVSLRYAVHVKGPATTLFPAGQTVPFARGPVFVRASEIHP